MSFEARFVASLRSADHSAEWTNARDLAGRFQVESSSAGEMVSAFAEENDLAVIVGTKTPGQLLSGSAFKVGTDIFSACQLPPTPHGEVGCWRTMASFRSSPSNSCEMH